MNNSKLNRQAVVSAAAAMVLALWFGWGTSAASATVGQYGDCQVSGTYGSYKLETAVPGQLTMKVPVPASYAYYGTTPDNIKSGYLYCLAAEIAYRAGIPKIVLVNISWDALVSGTVTGSDMSPYDMYATDARKKVADFSDPYMFSDTGVLVRKGSTLTEQSIKTAKIGVTVGSVQSIFVNDTLKPTQAPSVFPGEQDAYTAVLAGTVDVVLLDTVGTMPQTKKSNGALVTIARYEVGGGLCILLPKGSPNTPIVNKILADMKSDGSLQQVFKAWLYPNLGGDPNALPIWTAQ